VLNYLSSFIYMCGIFCVLSKSYMFVSFDIVANLMYSVYIIINSLIIHEENSREMNV
jgi:hypothetical protein